MAMEKVDDALETEDHEGVDVAEVRQGMAALEAGDVDEARVLLQDSITEALAERPLATGYETGTGLVPPVLSGRDAFGGGDWVVLLASIAVVGVGVWLSVRFRPHESVSALRLLLGTTPDNSGGSKRTTSTQITRHPR